MGDSIMRKARDTLEAAISLVEKNLEWGAEVVYGDTDRFVLPRFYENNNITDATLATLVTLLVK